MKPLIHFAHANAYPPASYRQFFEHLGDKYDILAPALRPLWPDADPDALTDWRGIGDDMIEMLDGNVETPVIGMGHSLGAVATMHAALKRPDLFRALVFVEPVFLPKEAREALRALRAQGEYEWPMVRMAQMRRDRWPSRQDAFDRFRQKSVFERFSDEALWDYVNAGLQPIGDEWTLTYSKLWEARIYALAPLDAPELVSGLTPPVLGFRGALTDTISADVWTQWQQTHAAATLVEMAEVGHLIPMEQPAQLAQQIETWLVNV